MARRQAYTVNYSPDAQQQLRGIERKHHSLIRQTIHEQLTFEPLTQTRNRKPLRSPVCGATWELRFGPHNGFRVLYAIDEENLEILVQAIGTKDGSDLHVEERDDDAT